MDERIKKTIAKEWVIFLICWFIGLVGYGIFWLYDLINFGRMQKGRLDVIPIISIGIYLLFMFYRSIFWAIKTLKKK